MDAINQVMHNRCMYRSRQTECRCKSRNQKENYLYVFLQYVASWLLEEDSNSVVLEKLSELYKNCVKSGFETTFYRLIYSLYLFLYYVNVIEHDFMISKTSDNHKSFKTIAVSLENFQALQKRGSYGDSMDDIITRVLSESTTTIAAAAIPTTNPIAQRHDMIGDVSGSDSYIIGIGQKMQNKDNKTDGEERNVQ
jgi:hypothetical protein